MSKNRFIEASTVRRASGFGLKRALIIVSASMAAATGAATPAAAEESFSSGSYVTPEGIAAGPASTYLVSDAGADTVFQVPASGGIPTVSDALGFEPYGEVDLSSYYGGLAGQYLVFGRDVTNTYGITALVGSSGLGPATNLAQTSTHTTYASAITAPTAYGAIAAGQVVLSTEGGQVDVLAANGTTVSTFATAPGTATFGLGFAPSTFGNDGGDLFVTDGLTGNLYVVNSGGQSTLFATLQLPDTLTSPGLRDLAWAPAGFGQYGGDLFVSIAASTSAHGASGEIAVLNSQGQEVALYDQGDAAHPLEPRGMVFSGSGELLVSNADPGIDVVTPSDFISSTSAAPEPAAWAMSLLGVGVVGISLRRRRTGRPERLTA
jgi:hypothetical protein